MADRFSEYMKAVERPFIKLCRLRFLNPDGSVAFALDNNVARQKNKTFIANGSLTANLQNGQRRTCTISLDNVNAEYDYAYGELWYGDEVALDEGLVLPDGTDFYIQQGVFLLDNPQEEVTPQGRTASYTLVDKWSNLDGSHMGYLENSYQVNRGVNIFAPIASLLAEDRGNGLPVDSITPIFTDYYNDMVQQLPDGTEVSLVETPYTLTIEGGNTKADVVTGLVAMVNGWVGYDASGALRVDPSQDDIADNTKPIIWRYSQKNSTLLGLSYTVNATEVYNDYIIVGDQLDDTTQPSARAMNFDPASDTNINIIGRKTFREESPGYGTDTMCANLAEWKLKRSTVMQKSVTVECSQILHIQENSLIEIERTDKVDDPIERHLVQGFSRPLTDNSPMTVNAISVMDFPDLTVTTPERTFDLGHIYGVKWSGGSSSAFTRTDEAAEFTAPAPAVNNGTGSSPFDELYPWNGMKRKTDAVAGELVAIPKYYYKWTVNGAEMTLQIATVPKDGYLVSPAHADRGDGKGERDTVYVGAYHCSNAFKSVSGTKPVGKITRTEARNTIQKMGKEIWSYDYAMYWTIMMLYLVEYADWNSQATIGYGCSDEGKKQNSGLTDLMAYHTGTSAATRNTPGHVRYRYIEGLWDNVFDWIEGIYVKNGKVYCTKNPAEYNASSGGTEVGNWLSPEGFIKSWAVPTAEGFEYALIPASVGGSSTTYICDAYYNRATGNGVTVGGGYTIDVDRGAFRMAYGREEAYVSPAVGCRLQKLPN